jgi:hypothetical protein
MEKPTYTAIDYNSKEEEEILMLTEEIWNGFLALPINHPMEANEMAIKIHDI